MQLPHSSARLYFVPLSKFPPAVLQALAVYYKGKYGLSIRTLPPVKLERSAVDVERHQLIAEELIASMKRRFPKLASDDRAIVLGITAGDMYTRSENWNYAFATNEGGFAVISSARMDPASYGLAADPGLLASRLRKMVTKRIGTMYYGLPASDSRQSVLYSPILSVDDLDSVGDDF